MRLDMSDMWCPQRDSGAFGKQRLMHRMEKECVIDWGGTPMSDEERDAWIAENERIHARTFVYKYYAHNLRLFYIGITGNFDKRDWQHVRSSRWRRHSWFAEVYEYETRELAALVEAWAHTDENPPMCRQWETPRGPREDLPEPPNPTWYYTRPNDFQEIEVPPEVDEDGLTHFVIDGEHVFIQVEPYDANPQKENEV